MSVDECEKKISITDTQKLAEFSLSEKQGLQMVRHMFQWANCRVQSHGSEKCETDYDSHITTVIENGYAAARFCLSGRFHEALHKFHQCTCLLFKTPFINKEFFIQIICI